MVKHIILWKLRDGISETEKAEIKANAKVALENLNGKIEGLKEINVQINSLESSNADMMLYSVFENEEFLKSYQINPLHKAAADTFVRPFTNTRLCLDFEE